jgi:hypothetical protein
MHDLDGLTAQLIAESKRNTHSQPAPRPVRQDIWAKPDALRILLPGHLTEGGSLYEVLCKRQAVRRFNKTPIDQGALATLLEAAESGDRSGWPSEQGRNSLQYLIVAWRVAGTPPAIYLYESRNRSLAMIGPAPDQEVEGPGLVLQPEFAGASAIVIILADLADALMRHGSRGHQMLLLRAGAAAQRMWLASIATGLEGTVFAGLLPRATQRLAGADGYRRAALFAYATGVAEITGNS